MWLFCWYFPDQFAKKVCLFPWKTCSIINNSFKYYKIPELTKSELEKLPCLNQRLFGDIKKIIWFLAQTNIVLHDFNRKSRTCCVFFSFSFLVNSSSLNGHKFNSMELYSTLGWLLLSRCIRWSDTIIIIIILKQI